MNLPMFLLYQNIPFSHCYACNWPIISEHENGKFDTDVIISHACGNSTYRKHSQKTEKGNFMRVLFSYSPTTGIVFMFDQEQTLPNDLVQSTIGFHSISGPVPGTQLPHLVPTALPVENVEDYIRNGKAVNCEICLREIKRNKGYRRSCMAGYLCATCQYEQNLPLRKEDIMPVYDANEKFDQELVRSGARSEEP